MTHKIHQEYKGINWEDVPNNYEKLRDLFIERYHAEEVDVEEYPNGENIEEIMTKDRVTANSKSI